MKLEFVLKITNDPVIDEVKFDSLEALQEKVKELQPEPAEGEEEEKPEEE